MKDMSNAEKVQVATDLVLAIDAEDSDSVAKVVVGLIAQNNPRLRAYAPLAKAAMAAVLRRLFGGEDDEKSALEEAAQEVAVEAVNDLLKRNGDREYAWYDPRGWF